MLSNEELNKIRGISIHCILGSSNSGRNVSIRCPIHNERTPSFIIYPDNSFHCFGCGINGSGAIDFTMKLGYTFQESIQELRRYI